MSGYTLLPRCGWIKALERVYRGAFQAGEGRDHVREREIRSARSEESDPVLPKDAARCNGPRERIGFLPGRCVLESSEIDEHADAVLQANIGCQRSYGPEAFIQIRMGRDRRDSPSPINLIVE